MFALPRWQRSNPKVLLREAEAEVIEPACELVVRTPVLKTGGALLARVIIVQESMLLAGSRSHGREESSYEWAWIGRWVVERALL